MPNALYVIAARLGSDEDDTGHEPLLFWNNEAGFGPLDKATVFSEAEALAHDLPIASDQPEWVQLPDSLNLARSTDCA